MDYKIISKRDEEKIKNIIAEQPKIKEMINRNLQYREDFLRSQRITNYQYEKSRFIGLENRMIGGLRYYAPTIKLDDFPDSENRRQQLYRTHEEDLIRPYDSTMFMKYNRFLNLFIIIICICQIT